jgi:hypothetical protein
MSERLKIWADFDLLAVYDSKSCYVIVSLRYTEYWKQWKVPKACAEKHIKPLFDGSFDGGRDILTILPRCIEKCEIVSSREGAMFKKNFL